jgi:hypothetical protein
MAESVASSPSMWGRWATPSSQRSEADVDGVLDGLAHRGDVVLVAATPRGRRRPG